jgi:hypothetical protein
MESDEGQQLPAQERLPAMTKKLAQPDKLSAKVGKETCRKFSLPVRRPSGQKQNQKLDSRAKGEQNKRKLHYLGLGLG